MSVYEDILACLEAETGLAAAEIEGLAKLLDVEQCDEQFLSYLSATIGTMIGEQARGDEFRRWLIKNLVNFYKIKGTHPSWGLQFQWLLNFWRGGWELWKALPEEHGDYEFHKDAGHQYKSARFDIYTDILSATPDTQTTSGQGTPDSLTTSQAQALLPYIWAIRPIHVLLRHYLETFTQNDNLGTISETSLFELDTGYAESLNGFGDTCLVTSCVAVCEAGACQTACETGCTGQGCQIGYEGSDSRALSCNMSCEIGGCEYGCEAGSCQTGCESCGREVELMPMQIAEITSGTTFKGSVWYPHRRSGQTMPPASDDPYWLHKFTDDAVDIKFMVIGDPGSRPLFDTGVPPDPTKFNEWPPVIPSDAQKARWMMVRCNLPELTVVEGPSADGEVSKWIHQGLDPLPHICTVKVVADLPYLETPVTGTTKNIRKINGTADLYVGNKVFISDGVKGESNYIAEYTPGKIKLKYPLLETYSDATLYRRKVTFSATANRFLPDAPTEQHWYVRFSGDVDELADLADQCVDYRTGTVVVTFRKPPPNGSRVTIEYYSEEDCIYTLVQPLTVLADGVQGVDPGGNLSFGSGDGPGVMFYWNPTLHSGKGGWSQVGKIPDGSTGKTFALLFDYDTGTPSWVEVKEFQCPL